MPVPAKGSVICQFVRRERCSGWRPRVPKQQAIRIQAWVQTMRLRASAEQRVTQSLVRRYFPKQCELLPIAIRPHYPKGNDPMFEPRERRFWPNEPRGLGEGQDPRDDDREASEGAPPRPPRILESVALSRDEVEGRMRTPLWGTAQSLPYSTWTRSRGLTAS